MNRKYRLHPGDYAIGETEALYAEMARLGWRLKKRGSLFSRFDREAPQALRYRVELASPGLLDEDSSLPEEQIALYQDCGWTFVTRCGLVNVFCAPEDSDAPEIYTDPRQQALTLKALSRSIWLSWLPSIVVLGLNLLIALTAASDPASAATRLAASIAIDWVRHTAPMLLCAGIVLLLLFNTAYGAARTMALRRRLKRGQPLDHAPRKRPGRRAVHAVILAAVALLAALTAAQFSSVRRSAMPQSADGPYLLLRDLGWEGERIPLSYKDKRSSVERSCSLAADIWDTFECVANGRGGEVWMYQDIYLMRSAAQARALVPALMHRAALARGPADFHPVSVEGLDAAYQSEMEYIAVKDNGVYCVTYLGSSFPPAAGTGDVFTALARKLNP